MNWRYVVGQLGLLFLLLSGAMLASLIGGWLFELNSTSGVDRSAMLAIGASVCIGAAIGCFCWFWTRKGSKHIGRREALLLVAVSWIIGAVLSALPYRLWAHWNNDLIADHPFSRFIDCYFEAMSGLTTTGATVLGSTGFSIEAIPHSLLLWRSATQWLGGLGIVVLFVAVLPTLGVGGKRLFRVEAPGPKPEGLQPHIRDTARVLLAIYAILTMVEVFALKIAGMTWFDSICHTFTTLATGGFSPKDASLGHYNSLAINVLVMIFMVFAGMNFALFYQLSRKQFKQVLKDTELRVYIVLILIGSAIVALSLLNSPIALTTGQNVGPSAADAIHQGVFTTISVQTTTGFCTSDFNAWPFAAKAVLVLMMFIGGSAGSTAGGIKVIRVWIMFKVMLAELEHVFRPQVVRPVRLGNSVIDDDLKLGTLAYVLGVALLIIVGGWTVMMFEQWAGDGTCDFTTAFTASIASLFTIGPGLGAVGAVENYGWMTPYSKLALSLLMALGRLEMFAILVLLMPRFWRAD